MTISRMAFEADYKKLEAAFGSAINKRRLDAYYDELAPVLTELSWEGLVRKFVRTHSAFPKLSEIIEAIGPVKPDKAPTLREQFIDDDCKVIECRGGTISYERGDYTEVARCPRCSRGPGGLPRYRGVVTLFTDEEMLTRRQERIEIINDQRVARRGVAEAQETAEELF